MLFAFLDFSFLIIACQDQEKVVNAKNEYITRLEADNSENQKNLQLTKDQYVIQIYPISVITFANWFMLLTFRVEELKSAAKRSEDNTRRSLTENMDLQSRCRTLEEDLRLEKEWRISLQDSIVTDRTAMAELQQQIEETKDVRNVCSFLLLRKKLNYDRET